MICGSQEFVFHPPENEEFVSEKKQELHTAEI
jgi:hypothetical protein